MSEGNERDIKMSSGIANNISVNSLKQTYVTYFIGNTHCPYIFFNKNVFTSLSEIQN